MYIRRRATAVQALHGAWITGRDGESGHFVLWAETGERRPRRKVPQGHGAAPRRHPFAVRGDALRDALHGLAPAHSLAASELRAVVARLPSSVQAPISSPTVGLDSDGAEPADLAPWLVDALILDPAAAVDLLCSIGDRKVAPRVTFGDDLRFWILATQLALGLLARQRFEPTLQSDGRRFLARWRVILHDEDRHRFATLLQAMPAASRALALEASAPQPQAREALRHFLDAVADGIARRALGGEWRTQGDGQTRTHGAAPAPALAWLEALGGNPIVRGRPRALAELDEEFRAWVEAARLAEGDSFRVCFRLEPPEDGGARWTLRYLLQATDDPSLLVPAPEVWRRRGVTARFLQRTIAHPQERLLAGLGQAARLFPPVAASLGSPAPEVCSLSAAEAYGFVREHAVLLQANGFGVLVPGLDAKLGARVRLRGTAPRPAVGTAFGWDAVVAFDWEVALGDESLSQEEFKALARLKEPLVQLRGRWIALDPDQIQRTLAFFQRQERAELSLSEAIRLALAPAQEGALPMLEVAAADWLEDLLQKLCDPQVRGREELGEPEGFEGQLRPYQRVGVAWLEALRRVGLGACLADDMGLGKTVQLIALLLHGRRDGQPPRPALLICPTSVVSNWRRELERFAPSLRVLVHHGAERTREGLAEVAARHDVVLSSYALLHRDQGELASVEWGEVVLDEAQNIKNPATKAAQVARALSGRWRAALTGTPVENRLEELWSIFHFLNPGYLGADAAFRRRYAIPIERARDPAATAELQRLVSPFILRRLKTDRTVIADLPEKQEMKVYCTLTREQATLYEAVVRDSLRQIEESEGIQRRGQVLATLTKLKQVCNHPALFLHDRSRLGGRSGKLDRLLEMLEEVFAVGERSLIFTQYAEMGKLLRGHLAEISGHEVLFLHGGTPTPERERLVARFQREGAGPGVFILSLKAGGTGLNLTGANHVFHFDRWWNPAVENQATDRAFRIGQRRDVQVHKFLCAGTFEETIDDLIERKVELAQAIVGTGEAWITEMTTEDLRDLFALRRDRVLEE